MSGEIATATGAMMKVGGVYQALGHGVRGTTTYTASHTLLYVLFTNRSSISMLPYHCRVVVAG